LEAKSSTTKVTSEASYNYTYRLIHHPTNKYISLRDITGNDLELLEQIINERESQKDLNIICDFLCDKVYCGKNLYRYDVRELSVKMLYVVFETYIDKIISTEYMDKPTWLKAVYYMQKNSFRDVAVLEKMPLNKFLVMLDIHKEAVNANTT
jgi:hypothetical protein